MKIGFIIPSLASLGISVNAQNLPNVICILADDIGYQDLSCYGARKISTPNLDNLAANGVPYTKSSPLPKVSTERKAPVIKAGSLGMSIRKTQTASAEPAARTASNAPVQQPVAETWEDYMFNEKDLGYYWREFASLLPKEEAANAGRMMNMHPHLLADQQTFEVAVDNDMVQKYMQQLAPKIEAHLQEKLHNRKIRMTTRVSEANENVRAYSHVERFQMMSKKNPSLLKLKEALGLELS